MAKKETDNNGPMHQTKAIILEDIEPNSTVNDILTKHLRAGNKAKTSLSPAKLERYQRAIKCIQIKNGGTRAEVIFSSIFYWCKFSRAIMNKVVANPDFKASISPSYFQHIHHVQSMSFASVTHGQRIVIQEFHGGQDMSAYLIGSRSSLFISFKVQSSEFLLVIDKAKISRLRCQSLNLDMDAVHVSLREAASLYEWYHMNDIWICDHCQSVNTVPMEHRDVTSSVLASPMRCMCCDTECDDNNDIHIRQINAMVSGIHLDATQCNFSTQTQFYRAIASFETAPNETFDVLHALWNVLTPSTRSIGSTIMFSNSIQLSVVNSKIPGVTIEQYFGGVKREEDSEQKTVAVDEGGIDFEKQRSQLRDTFLWLDRFAQLRFPLLRKLISFENPGCFVAPAIVDQYITAIESAVDGCGTPQWLVKEAMEQTDGMHAAALEERVQELEDEYEQQGLLEDAAYKTFVFKVVLKPNAICIEEADQFALNENAQWNALQRVSDDNYVISFPSCFPSFDVFSSVKQIMLYKSYLFLHRLNKHELMFRMLPSTSNSMQYGATELSNFLTDEKLVEYYKAQPQPSQCDSWNGAVGAKLQDVDKKAEIDVNSVFKHEHENENDHEQELEIRSPPMKKAKHEHAALPVVVIKDEKEEEKQLETIELTQTTEATKSEPTISIVGQKRKRSPSVSLSPSPSPPASPTPPPSVCKSEHKKMKEDTPLYPNCQRIDGVMFAFGVVPIYNSRYYSCADFALGDAFNTPDFAQLLIENGCQRDVIRDLALRGVGRFRQVVKEDEGPPAFLSLVDEKYPELFGSCFAHDLSEADRVNIDLLRYATDAQIKKRRRMAMKMSKLPRPFVFFERDLSIKKSMKYILYTLLRIYHQWITKGIINVQDPSWSPPWLAPMDMDIITESIKGLDVKCVVIDITDLSDGDDDDEADNGGVKMNDSDMIEKNVTVKQEFDSDSDFSMFE